MPSQTSNDAELTLVTPSPPADEPERDRAEVGAELDGIRNSLGMSVRALAERISVDRETLRKVLDGDPTVMKRKLANIDAQIRALDDEMGSERQESPEPEPDDVVEIRIEPTADTPGATVILRGSQARRPDIGDVVARLVRKMGTPPPD
jgi:transcriptional regulator with XRE-family HTH domain